MARVRVIHRAGHRLPLNDRAWRADVPDILDLVPREWEAAVDDRQYIAVILRTDPQPEIEAKANGHTVPLSAH